MNAVVAEADAELTRRLFVLLKAAVVYGRENAGYREHAVPAFASLARALARERELLLQVEQEDLALNGRRAGHGPGERTAARYLADTLSRLGAGGLRFEAGADSADLDAAAFALARAPRGSGLKELRAALVAAGARSVSVLAPQAFEAAAAPDGKTPDAAPAAAPARPSAPPEDAAARARRSFHSALTEAERMMTGLREGRVPDLAGVAAAVGGLVESVTEDEQELFALSVLRDYDEYTYAHCVNVCVYGLGLGVRLGLGGEALAALGLACLFHDAGKARLPRGLIDKPGALNEDEWRLMRRHPSLGAAALLALKARPDPALARAALVAFEHHRGADGKGYPSLPGPRRQDLFSRICALADAFDALTSGRVYARRALAPDEAVLRMAQRAGADFDPLLLRLFVATVGVFPIGTLLLLDTGERGVVRRNSPGDPLRPSLLLLGPGGGKAELSALDPSGRPLRTVVKALDPKAEGVDASSLLAEPPPG